MSKWLPEIATIVPRYTPTKWLETASYNYDDKIPWLLFEFLAFFFVFVFQLLQLLKIGPYVLTVSENSSPAQPQLKKKN